MRCVAVIPVRCDSGRLPGKAQVDLGGRLLLGHVIARARRIAECVEVAVATSDRQVDDRITEIASAAGIHVHRGSCADEPS